MDEILDIIDENNNVIGQAPKKEAHGKGLRHRVSAILLYNDKNQYLIPTASNKKVESGGLYHSAAGHINSGETYLKAAIRELQEEVGLTIKPQDAVFAGSFWLEKEFPTRIEKERFEVFKVKYTKDMGEIVFNEEQINEQWLDESTLRDIYVNEPQRLSTGLFLSCRFVFGF